DCGRPADVKYFLWVKRAACARCETVNDLFPGFLLAEAERHPKHVLACRKCGELNECESVPSRSAPAICCSCGADVHVEGTVSRQRLECQACGATTPLPRWSAPPAHRLWALEYHCVPCKAAHAGRFFKQPD